MSFVWSYMRYHPRQLSLGFFSLVGRDAIAFTIPLLIRAGLNSLSASTSSAHTWSVAWIGTAMIVVAIPRSAFHTIARLNVMSTSRDVEYAMRRDLLGHLFQLDASFWSRTRTGDIMASATNDLNAVRMMLGPGLSSLFESLVSLPVAIVVMALVNWHLTLVALLPAPFAVILLVWFGRIIRIRFDAIQGMFSTMSTAVQQTIAGARVVRSFVREEAEQRRFETMNLAFLKANRVLGGYSSSLDPLLTFIIGLSVLVVLCYGGTQVLAGTLSVGSFVMFTIYAAMLVRPISSLGRVVNLMQRGMASVGRLQMLFSEVAEIKSDAVTNATIRDEKSRGAITFENVQVNYGSQSVIESLQLEIRAGSTVAILGETGSGKSTLVRLITRMIDPTRGRVLIDGTDCRRLSLPFLRSMIGCTPQDTFLFSTTLAENIALGAPDASEQDIRDAAEIAGLASDLEALPEGYATIVGERGVMLSGGQKQRVAIARAILMNPRILILDDALSSVDSVTEERILLHLKNIMEERTTVLITHRVATAMRADHIVVLQRGRIMEQGTHTSLLARDSQYARLYRLQTLERELEVM
jgi:ATP-binding cassette subfamily B multidrug efflux pump